MARRKCSISTSVFFTSEEYTSDPTMGQKGTYNMQPQADLCTRQIKSTVPLPSDFLAFATTAS